MMRIEIAMSTEFTIAHALHDAWGAVERRLNGSLGAVLGVTYSEHRLLAALGVGGDSGASRVDLAKAVGLTPSAVTRALRPLSVLGYVTSVAHPRDARMSIAKLTASGEELLTNSTNLLNDVGEQIRESAPALDENQEALAALCRQLSEI